MKKQMIMTVAALALLVTMSLPISAKAAEVTLSYANFPPASTFVCVQMERWKTEVEKRTNGEVKVDTYPGGTLLNARNMLRGVRMGQADIGCVSLAYHPGVFPVMGVTELPVGFTSSTVASLATYDLYASQQPKELSKVKVLTMFTSAPSSLMTKTPVTSLADLKGMEIRGAGMASQVLDKLGAIPVSMPMPETPEALQKGLVKGVLTSLEVLKDMNFAEYCPYQTVTNFQVYPFAVIMNMKKWNSLSDETKKVLEDLARDQAEWTGKYMDNHVKNALAWTKDKTGNDVMFMPADQMAEAQELLKPLTAEWKTMATDKGINADAVMGDLQQIKINLEKQYPAE
ncbi:MAG: TRAP transporter substrate-binding protein [Desulfovibrio sp.]